MVIGFDVSKQSVNWAVVNRAGRQIASGKCLNQPEVIATVLVAVQTRHPRLVCAVESTGICHLPTVRACTDPGIPCRLINPIQTKQFTRSTVRMTKTDKRDAYYIALLGLREAGYLVRPVDDAMNQARTYLRLASRLQANHSKLELMRQYLEATGLELDEQALVACQVAVKTAVETYRGLATALLTPTDGIRLLRSVPGVGERVAPGILAEIGDVSRFKSATQLVAYAGLDPRIKQSGMSSSTGKLTKRGSPYLRHYLYMAAMQARRFDPELAAAYQRQRDRGKRYTVTTVYIARRLVYRIYAVLKRGEPYVVRPTLRPDCNVKT